MDKRIIIPIIVFLAMIYLASAATPYPCDFDPFRTLSRCYHVDNNCNEEVVGVSCTNTGGTFNNSVGGTPFDGGYSISYTGGANQHLDSNFNNIQLRQNYSICFWTRVGPFADADYLFGARNAPTVKRIDLNLVAAQGYDWAISDTLTSRTDGDGTEDNILTDGDWHHFCAIHDSGFGAARMKVYIDGIKQTADVQVNGAFDADKLAQDIWFGTTNNAGSELNTINADYDDILIFNETNLTDTQILTIFNGNFTNMKVNIIYPGNSSGFNEDNLTVVNHNLWVNITHNNDTTTSCGINDTRWTAQGAAGTFNETFLNNTNLGQGRFDITVFCNRTDSLNGTANVILTIDTTLPVIDALNILRNNKTVIYNGTLSTNINFTDNLEIFSINFTLENGTVLFNRTNLGVAAYQMNLSVAVDTILTQTATVEVCDAHTDELIGVIENKVEKAGIKYVYEKQLIFFDKKWVHIYPKDFSEYTPPYTNKLADRYTFTFNKNKNTLGSETFIIESSDYIYITEGQNYLGHVVIKGLDTWVDLENNKATSYQITRINGKKIEVTLNGLSGDVFEFNSIGKLNCVNQSYKFTNINPVISFASPVVVGLSNIISLNISENRSLMSTPNATLYYNFTSSFAGVGANFTDTITAPSLVNKNNSNISVVWELSVNNQTFNLTQQFQNVSNFFLDNCTAFTTKAINYSVRDEENNSLINADINYNYVYNVGTGINKTLVDTFTDDVFAICLFPNWTRINADYTIFYEATVHPQRRFDDNNGLFTNFTIQQPLFLLNVDEGIFIRFATIDTFSNTLSDVTIRNEKLIGGIFQTVELEITDDSGIATFFVDPDVDYRFTFTKIGFQTQIATLRPTTSEIITVQMVSTTALKNVSLGTGIRIIFNPQNTNLNNNTDTSFTVNLTSDHYDITGCTHVLRNSTTTLNTTVGTFTTRRCDAELSLNTNNQTSIISEIRYNLNGSAQQNKSIQYTIVETYTGQFSLQTFIDDLTSFSDAGFNDFTRSIIGFIVTFSIVSFLSKTGEGFREPTSTVIVTLALIWGFSLIGWFNLNLDTIPEIIGLPTGWLKKYIIAIILSTTGGAYLIKKHTD